MEDSPPPVEAPKTPKKSRAISDKIKCPVHKKEILQFLCQTDKTKICGICVP